MKHIWKEYVSVNQSSSISMCRLLVFSRAFVQGTSVDRLTDGSLGLSHDRQSLPQGLKGFYRGYCEFGCESCLCFPGSGQASTLTLPSHAHPQQLLACSTLSRCNCTFNVGCAVTLQISVSGRPIR